VRASASYWYCVHIQGCPKKLHISIWDHITLQRLTTDDGCQGKGWSCWISSELTEGVRYRPCFTVFWMKIEQNSCVIVKFNAILVDLQFMQIRQRIFNCTDMQLMYFIQDKTKFWNFSRITRLSIISRCKVVISNGNVHFLATLYSVFRFWVTDRVRLTQYWGFAPVPQFHPQMPFSGSPFQSSWM